jgi:ParB-like chromosome segregation protein Spo0J
MTPPKHLLAYLPVDDLIPNAWNAQTQSEDVFLRLVDEIAEVGFIDPIEVVALEDGRSRIIGGEHRWMAAKKAGLDEVPCVVLQGKKWNDVDLQKFVTVRLNAIRGKIDPAKFAKLYEEMAGKYGKEALQALMGYTDAKAFSKVVDGARKGLKKALPPDMVKEFDKAAKDAHTVEDLQKIIQMLFAKYGDTVEKSFMVFTYGKQEHIYVAMSRPMKKAMDKVVGYCKVSGADLNEVMAPIAHECMQKAIAALAAAKDAAPPVENPFAG